MSGPIKWLGRHQVVQFVPTVKAVRSEMLPTIDAAGVGELKEPGFEGSAARVELVHGPEYIQEHLLDGLFRFPIIVEDCPCDSEDQSTMPLKQDCQRIVAAHTQ